MLKFYATISGDMWDSIALKAMGSESYTDALIESNLQYKHIYIFPAGIRLVIPEIKVKTSSGLPPWKRGVQS